MPLELADIVAEINGALDVFLPTESAIAQPVVDTMRHSVLGGGKRLRPLLACATCHTFGAPLQQALPAGCALEFIHCYSLIHDDLPAMDDDDIRHGIAAAHVAYGEANAILAGDSLHSLAFQTIAASNTHDALLKLHMIELLAEAAGWAGMAGGQCLDIEAEGKPLTLEQLKVLHAAKTGALIRVAVQLGALSSDNVEIGDEQYTMLTEFGDLIGLAFQVMDDVLDVTGSTEQLGKPAGSDEGLDKNTFPKLLGLEPARQLAQDLVAQSLALLNDSPLDTRLLEDLSHLVVNRSH